MTPNEEGEIPYEKLFDEITLSGMAIEDPLREHVKEAIRKCKQAGVIVHMVTGDNVKFARSIATDWGIYKNGVVIESPEFCSLSSEETDKILPRLEVLARG